MAVSLIVVGLVGFGIAIAFHESDAPIFEWIVYLSTALFLAGIFVLLYVIGRLGEKKSGRKSR